MQWRGRLSILKHLEIGEDQLAFISHALKRGLFVRKKTIFPQPGVHSGGQPWAPMENRKPQSNKMLTKGVKGLMNNMVLDNSLGLLYMMV